jgi:hypothetical protein
MHEYGEKQFEKFCSFSLYCLPVDSYEQSSISLEHEYNHANVTLGPCIT